MTDYRAIATENARQEFAPVTFGEPFVCDVCSARVQVNRRDGLVYDAAYAESGPHAHTCFEGQS